MMLTHGLASRVAAAEDERLRVGLIDRASFSRDSLVRAINSCHPDLLLVPFDTIDDCIDAGAANLNVILFHLHSDGPSEVAALRSIKTLREVLGDLPVIVLSDTPRVLETRQVRSVLAGVGKGLIPSLPLDLQLAFAAIRLVKHSGTFVSADASAAGGDGQVPAVERSHPSRLTPRQEAVLEALRQGKANKIIAYELGMTKNTVKIHVRNIMRKLGATNRTQAVYKAQQLGAPEVMAPM